MSGIGYLSHGGSGGVTRQRASNLSSSSSAHLRAVRSSSKYAQWVYGSVLRISP